MILKLKTLKTEEVNNGIMWLGAFQHNSWILADLNGNQI